MSPNSQSTDLEFVLGVLFVPILLLIAVGLAFVPIEWVPRCWLREGTGIPCPACGSYRAFQMLIHGDLAAAFRQQPFALVAGLGAIGYSVYAFLAVFGRISPLRLTRRQRWLAIAAVVLFVGADWVYVLFQ